MMVLQGLKQRDYSFLILALEQRLLVLIFRLLFRKDHWIGTSLLAGGMEDLFLDIMEMLSIITRCGAQSSLAVIRYVRRSVNTIDRLYSTGRFLTPEEVPVGPKCREVIEEWQRHLEAFRTVIFHHARFLNDAIGGCFEVSFRFLSNKAINPSLPISSAPHPQFKL
jgi:hypothetical protein